MSGKKDVLGMYVGENESAKFWLSIMNGLKNRGVEDKYKKQIEGDEEIAKELQNGNKSDSRAKNQD